MASLRPTVPFRRLFAFPQLRSLYPRGVLKHRRENKIIHVLHCWRCSSYSTPNRYQLKDGGAVCGFCGDKNPLGNMVRLPLMLVTEPHTIYVAFTR
jgi:hypothetical protein